MVEVLLGHSYFLRFDPKLWSEMRPYPPLGTLYAAGYARAQGYTVAVFDAMLAESEAEWASALAAHQPRFAVLFEDNFNYLSKMCLLRMRQAAHTMIGMAKARGCCVIVAGADMTDHPDLYLAAGADYVIRGEGEATLVELLNAVSHVPPADARSIAGVMSGMPTPFVPRATLRDLDELPAPAWDLINLDQYRAVWRARHGYFSLNLVTTRGCPYHCNWCAKPIWGQRYAAHSPERVAAEMTQLKAWGAEHIWFMDDIFGLQPQWLDRFADAVQAARLPFKCLLRADLVTEAAAQTLARAGCQTVWLGAESGSQKILDAMEKGQTVAEIERATQRLRAQGIRVGFFLQFGYPGETWHDIGLTRRLVRGARPDEIGISVSYPLPGTKFFARVQAELGAQQNWVDSDDLALLYRGPFPSEFYRVLYRLLHAEFALVTRGHWPALARWALSRWQLQRYL